MPSTERTYRVKILKRTRATGGDLLLPGKEYDVIKADFQDLIRCGKGIDPTGKLKVPPPPMNKKDTGQEREGGKGTSPQTVGTRTIPGGKKDDPIAPPKGSK